eukprot:scaffold4872_cov116-Isochrysis_galbana.AAC.1
MVLFVAHIFVLSSFAATPTPARPLGPRDPVQHELNLTDTAWKLLLLPNVLSDITITRSSAACSNGLEPREPHGLLTTLTCAEWGPALSKICLTSGAAAPRPRRRPTANPLPDTPQPH